MGFFDNEEEMQDLESVRPSLLAVAGALSVYIR